jgi:hypothetical protein
MTNRIDAGHARDRGNRRGQHCKPSGQPVRLEDAIVSETRQRARMSISARPPARAGKKEKNIKSKKIDFSDIPQLSDKQPSQMRRVGRPTVGRRAKKAHRDPVGYRSIIVVMRDRGEKRESLPIARQ